MPRISSSELGRNPGSPVPWAPSSRLPPVPGHGTGPSLQEVSLPACRRGKSLFDGPAGLAEEAAILLRGADTNSLVRATDREKKGEKRESKEAGKKTVKDNTWSRL